MVVVVGALGEVVVVAETAGIDVVVVGEMTVAFVAGVVTVGFEAEVGDAKAFGHALSRWWYSVTQFVAIKC
jgi:hypothetical protein